MISREIQFVSHFLHLVGSSFSQHSGGQLDLSIHQSVQSFPWIENPPRELQLDLVIFQSN
jgi:hypothetical protein